MCKPEHCKHLDGIETEKPDYAKLAETGRCYTIPKPQREPGFYWVKPAPDELVVALWSGERWHFIDGDVLMGERGLFEIDERRIERQPIEGTGCGCNDINSEVIRLIDIVLDSGLFVETNQLRDIKNRLTK